MNSLNPLRNPLDPIHKSGPEAGRELFAQIAKVCHGFPNDAVLDCAINLLIQPVRQQNSSWQNAERIFDERIARAKQLLREHYDANGKRRNVFPFLQHVSVEHVKDDEKY